MRTEQKAYAQPSGPAQEPEAVPLPRTAKGARTRARIVEAAAELMYERGAGMTKLEDIKASAGVSSSQVYHYFADKQELMRAVVAHQAESLVAAQRAEDLSTVDGLRRWGELLVERERQHSRRGGPLTDLVGGDLAETDAQGRVEAAEGLRRWAGLIGEGLHAMREAGGLPSSADPDALSLAILAGVQGGVLLARVQHDVAPLQAAIDSLVQLIELLGSTTAAPPPSPRTKARRRTAAGSEDHGPSSPA